MRFSAATTAERFMLQRRALRMSPLLDRIDAVPISANERRQACARFSTVWCSPRLVRPILAPAKGDA